MAEANSSIRIILFSTLYNYNKSDVHPLFLLDDWTNAMTSGVKTRNLDVAASRSGAVIYGSYVYNFGNTLVKNITIYKKLDKLINRMDTGISTDRHYWVTILGFQKTFEITNSGKGRREYLTEGANAMSRRLGAIGVHNLRVKVYYRETAAHIPPYFGYNANGVMGN